MEQKPTQELNHILNNMKPDQLDSYLKDNKKYLADEKKAFYYFMKDVLDEKNIRLKDLYSFAGESESYGSQILRMEKHTLDRDVILRLCIAGHFTFLETNRALKLYGFSELYSKEPRDACIIIAINNRIYDFAKIDDMLTTHGFKELSRKSTSVE